MTEWIVSSSALICAVLLLRRVLQGRINPRLRYALWALVLVRLILPMSFFSSSISIQNIRQDVLERPEVQQAYSIMTTPIAPPGAQADTGNHGVSELPGEAAPPQISNSVVPQPQQSQQSQQKAPEAHALEWERSVSAVDILLMVWITGMVVMAAWLTVSNVHFSLRLRRSRVPLEISASPLEVYVTNAVETPCLFGLFRPAVYLTREAAAHDQVRKYVLTHELTHYRQFDHVWAVLRAVCLVLHWYNPLVWIAFRASRRDGEMACDEGTLKTLGEEHRGDYGRTLISLATRSRLRSTLVTATTLADGKKAIRERIVILMKNPKTAGITMMALILCCTLVVGCTFTGALEDTQPTETTPVETTTPVEANVPEASALPWTPDESEALRYEAYFETVRSYDDGCLITGRSWSGYSVSYGEGELLVTDNVGTVLHTVPNVDADINWVVCDDNWIYGVRNGTELLRIDYWGENEEVLFEGGVHSIGLEFTGRVYLADECVLFFAACSDEGSRICRLYIPDLTMEVVAESDASLISLSNVLSNHEVVWYEDNPAFDALMEDLMANLPEKYAPNGDPIDDLESWVSQDYKIPRGVYHYINTSTGEEYTLNNYGGYYSERTQENIAAYGDAWWNDFRVFE